MSRLKIMFSDRKTDLALLFTGIGGFFGILVVTSILTIFNYFLNTIITNASASGNDLGFLGTTFSILFIFGALAGAILANRFGRMWVMIVSSVLSVFGLLYCGWVVGNDSSQTILGIILFAAGTSSVLVMMVAILVEKFYPFGLSGLAAALIIIADRLAAPGGASLFLSFINPSGLAMVYSAAGLIELAGLAIAIGILLIAARTKTKELLPEKFPLHTDRTGILLLFGTLAFLTAASSALSNNLQVAFFTRSGMTWETLDVIFSTAVPKLFLVLAALGAGLLSDLVNFFGYRQGKSLVRRIGVLILSALLAGVVLFMLANTSNLGTLLGGLSSFTPLESSAITALLALLFIYVRKERINLTAGIYIAFPPVAVAFFNLLTSLVVPVNDYESPLVFAQIYFVCGLTCVVILLVRALRLKPPVIEKRIDEPTGPR